jgi:hypothetical protein
MIDPDRINAAIMATGLPPLALETGANLVDEWAKEFYDEDSQYEIVAVECGFVLELDQNTLAIGVQDVIMRDAKGVFGNEWKNVKEPRKDSRGRDSSWWNEEVWLREISTGSQVGLYAAAIAGADFYDRSGEHFSFANEPTANSRVRVRAAVKSNPVRFWPSEDTGVYSFDSNALQSIRNGFLAKAEQIRCARKAGIVPFQLPGKQCFPFNRTCSMLDKFCSKHEPPTVLEGEDKQLLFDESDPATVLAVPHIDPDRFDNPNLVVLSASSYDMASQCLELHRIVSGSMSEKDNEESNSVAGMHVGTVAHAGYSEFYRMIKEEQQEKTK